MLSGRFRDESDWPSIFSFFSVSTYPYIILSHCHHTPSSIINSCASYVRLLTYSIKLFAICRHVRIQGFTWCSPFTKGVKSDTLQPLEHCGGAPRLMP